MQSQPSHEQIALPPGFKLVSRQQQKENVPKLPPGITIKTLPKNGPNGNGSKQVPNQLTPQLARNNSIAVSGPKQLERTAVVDQNLTGTKANPSGRGGAKPLTPQLAQQISQVAVPSGCGSSGIKHVPQILPKKTTPAKRPRNEETPAPIRLPTAVASGSRGVKRPEYEPDEADDDASDKLLPEPSCDQQAREISLEYVVTVMERMEKRLHAECILNARLKNEIKSLRCDISSLGEELTKIRCLINTNPSTGKDFKFPIENDEQLMDINENFSCYEDQLRRIFVEKSFNTVYDFYRYYAEQILKNVSYYNWTGVPAHNSSKNPENASILKIFQLLLKVGMEKSTDDVKTATSTMSRAINNYNFAVNRFKQRHGKSAESEEPYINDDEYGGSPE